MAEKVLASKEQVRMALEALVDLEQSIVARTMHDDSRIQAIRETLKACERKLPSAAAYAREQQRKRGYWEKKKARQSQPATV